MARRALRDLVVLLPGITGSVLRKDGRDLWALSGEAAWSAMTSGGEALAELKLEDGDPGSVEATALMSDVHLVPGLVKIVGYSAVGRMLADTFEVVPARPGERRPANFVEFPYDWRLDNRVSARRLEAIVDDALGKWRAYTGDPGARVILLAHSMGGLVARYYLEVLEHWQDCRALVTFGTPYRGSLNALGFLANGYKKLFVDLTAAMRSFPSVHQLLPIYPAVRDDVGWVRIAEGAPLSGVDAALATDALTFHREIESAVTSHRDDPGYRRHGYVIMPFVGTRQPTNQSAARAGDRLTISRQLPDWMDALLDGGDGTVPRASATPIELSDAYRDSFFPERHSTLHANLSVLSDLRGRLEQMQARGLGTIRDSGVDAVSSERPAIALDLADAYVDGEPVVMTARLVLADPAEPLRARIEPVSGGHPRVFDFVPGPVEQRLEVQAPPGVYRVKVHGARAGLPAVRDVFAVGDG